MSAADSDDVIMRGLRAMWVGDQPPEQVDIDAMAAYDRYRPGTPSARRRAVVAWVGLAIGLASTAAIFIAIGLLLRQAYR